MQNLINLIPVMVSGLHKMREWPNSAGGRRRIIEESWELLREAELFLREQGKLGHAANSVPINEAVWTIGTERGGNKLLWTDGVKWTVQVVSNGIWCDHDLGDLRRRVEERFGKSWGWPDATPASDRPLTTPDEPQSPAPAYDLVAAPLPLLAELEMLRLELKQERVAHAATGRECARAINAEDGLKAELTQVKTELEIERHAVKSAIESHVAANKRGDELAQANYQLMRELTALRAGLFTPGTALQVTMGRITVAGPRWVADGNDFILDGQQTARIEIAAGKVLGQRLEPVVEPAERKYPPQPLQLAATLLAAKHAAELFKSVEAQLRPFAMAQDDVKGKIARTCEAVAKEVVDICLAAE